MTPLRSETCVSGRMDLAPIRLQDLDFTPLTETGGGVRNSGATSRDQSTFSVFTAGVFDVLACTVALTHGGLEGNTVEQVAMENLPYSVAADSLLDDTARDRGLLLAMRNGAQSNRENEARLALLTERLRSLDSRVSADAIDVLTETIDRLADTESKLAEISKEFDL